MDYREKTSYVFKIGQAFKPGTPINKWDLFAGRKQQIESILRAINQAGRHIVIFGERGVGKTSLSKILSEVVMESGANLIVPDSINCDGTDNFGRIWHKVFREIFAYLNVRNIETPRQIAVDNDDLFYDSPDDIRYLFNLLSYPSIIVLDEIDRLPEDDTITLLSDTIKTLSDHATPVTLVLIGIADSVDELIKEHRSVERSLVPVHLHRMFPYELREIITKGIDQTGINFDTEAIDRIVQLSSGLPHYTHTLASNAAHHVIDEDRTNVNLEDVSVAIRKYVEAPGPLLSAYEKSTSSPQKDALYAQVLLACALAEKTDLGYFSAADIRAPLEKITSEKYQIPAFSRHLNAFCSDERGKVLQKSGEPRRFRFRFVNPLLQPFVIIHGLSKGLLQPSMLSLVPKSGKKNLFS